MYSITLSLIALVAFLAPAEATFRPFQLIDASCGLSKISNPKFPSGQTALAVPSGQKLAYVTVGVGVQNYTCGDAGTFVSAGALATIFDASCYSKIIDDLPPVLLKAYQLEPLTIKLLGATKLKLGDHLFVTNPVTGNGTVPKFDFTARRGKDNYFDGSKAGGIKAPSAAEANVDWLQLSHVLGDLANTVFRIHTAGGQPPTSCKAGQRASIPYAAEYWFYK